MFGKRRKDPIEIAAQGTVYGAHREIVLANSAAALVAASRAADFLDGVRVAAESIDSGAAHEKLEAFIAFTQQDSERALSGT